jgi:hypothetical protein
MKARPFIPPQLEVRTAHGVTLIRTAEILGDPDLQKRCVEQRELKRIMKIVGKQEAEPPRPAPRRLRRKRQPI